MTLKILEAHINETDESLLSLLKLTTANVLETNEPFELFISGFDSNPIPLWAIEAASKFSKRLVELGFLSVLKTVPNIEKREVMRGWTSYELWLCARNELGPDIDIERMIGDIRPTAQFMRDVMKSNEKCDRLVGRK